MESKKDDSKDAQFGNLISPVVIAVSLLFLFLATSSLDGRDLGNELNSAILATISVLVPACIGKSSRLIPLDNRAARIGSLTVALLVVGTASNYLDPDSVSYTHLTLPTKA